MIDGAALAAAEAHAERMERIVARLRRLHGFSEAEAIFFIEQIGAAAIAPVDEAGDSRGTSLREAA